MFFRLFVYFYRESSTVYRFLLVNNIVVAEITLGRLNVTTPLRDSYGITILETSCTSVRRIGGPELEMCTSHHLTTTNVR